MAVFSSVFKQFELTQATRSWQKGSCLSDKQLEIKDKCEKSFYEFVRHFWKTVENRNFIDGWHVKAVCDHLQAAYNLEINQLLLNLPPRTGKSNILCVFFPAWCWAKDAGLRFLYTSYAQILSVRDSVGCRRLITSGDYQALWGDQFHLMADVNTKLRFDTNKSGYRIASSSGGTNTGFGGDFVICLPYESKIMTDRGELSIGTIVEQEINCKLLSYNHKYDILEYKEIEAFEKNEGRALLEIELEDGTIIECTEDHPVWIEGKGYISAKDIQEGDVVLGLSFLDL